MGEGKSEKEMKINEEDLGQHLQSKRLKISYIGIFWIDVPNERILVAIISTSSLYPNNLWIFWSGMNLTPNCCTQSLWRSNNWTNLEQLWEFGTSQNWDIANWDSQLNSPSWTWRKLDALVTQILQLEIVQMFQNHKSRSAMALKSLDFNHLWWYSDLFTQLLLLIFWWAIDHFLIFYSSYWTSIDITILTALQRFIRTAITIRWDLTSIMNGKSWTFRMRFIFNFDISSSDNFKCKR